MGLKQPRTGQVSTIKRITGREEGHIVFEYIYGISGLFVKFQDDIQTLTVCHFDRIQVYSMDNTPLVLSALLLGFLSS